MRWLPVGLECSFPCKGRPARTGQRQRRDLLPAHGQADIPCLPGPTSHSGAEQTKYQTASPKYKRYLIFHDFDIKVEYLNVENLALSYNHNILTS